MNNQFWIWKYNSLPTYQVPTSMIHVDKERVESKHKKVFPRDFWDWEGNQNEGRDKCNEIYGYLSNYFLYFIDIIVSKCFIYAQTEQQNYLEKGQHFFYNNPEPT